MTYEEFLAETQKRQREYIQAEQVKINKADAAFFHYRSKMADIGLHPLTREEITERRDRLRVMLTRVNDTHGDTPTMRTMYEFHEAKVA